MYTQNFFCKNITLTSIRIFFSLIKINKIVYVVIIILSYSHSHYTLYYLTTIDRCISSFPCRNLVIACLWCYLFSTYIHYSFSLRRYHTLCTQCHLPFFLHSTSMITSPWVHLFTLSLRKGTTSLTGMSRTWCVRCMAAMMTQFCSSSSFPPSCLTSECSFSLSCTVYTVLTLFWFVFYGYLLALIFYL